MKEKSSILFLISAIILASCGYSYDEMLGALLSESVPFISPEEARKKIEKEEVVILDVRAIEEYQVSHIENALHLDPDTFNPTDLEELDRKNTVLVYCTVGYRSEKLGEKLIEMGFDDVRNIYGGIFGWKNNDLRLVNLSNESTDSVHTYNKSWSKWLNKGIKVYE